MQKKSVALGAHDNRKPEMVEWVKSNRNNLSALTLYATGITGKYDPATILLLVAMARKVAAGHEPVAQGHCQGDEFVVR